MATNEPNEKKKDINDEENDNTGGDKGGDIKGGIKGGINEGINKRLLFKKKRICYTIFFKAFTISTAFAAFTKRNFTGKSY